MKTIHFLQYGLLLLLFIGCQPQTDEIGEIGTPPSNGSITVDDSDPYHPVFTAAADNGFIYDWNLGNGQKKSGQTVTDYYPFAGDYEVVSTVSGAGAANVVSKVTFNVAQTDPNIANKPVWKELTNAGEGRTWIYNTDPVTGFPDYSFQTTGDLVTYPENWKPELSWGQCVRITPDINGEMTFDLDNGINFTYHQTAGDIGVTGSFILDPENMTLTVVDPYILDYNVECTVPEITASGAYDIKLLTDEEMVLWQNQENGTGWSWSFKSK